jgi:hypothetical protein
MYAVCHLNSVSIGVSRNVMKLISEYAEKNHIQMIKKQNMKILHFSDIDKKLYKMLSNESGPVFPLH